MSGGRRGQPRVGRERVERRQRVVVVARAAAAAGALRGGRDYIRRRPAQKRWLLYVPALPPLGPAAAEARRRSAADAAAAAAAADDADAADDHTDDHWKQSEYFDHYVWRNPATRAWSASARRATAPRRPKRLPFVEKERLARGWRGVCKASRRCGAYI